MIENYRFARAIARIWIRPFQLKLEEKYRMLTGGKWAIFNRVVKIQKITLFSNLVHNFNLKKNLQTILEKKIFLHFFLGCFQNSFPFVTIMYQNYVTKLWKVYFCVTLHSVKIAHFPSVSFSSNFSWKGRIRMRAITRAEWLFLIN